VIVIADHAIVSKADKQSGSGTLHKMLIEAKRLVLVILGW
jgi:hypothetical protein